MDPGAWAYYAGAAGAKVTLRDNRDAFERLRLRPRVLVDVSQCELDTTVLGASVRMPILVAPSAAHGYAHSDGECATARGAGAAETLMVASTESTRSLEEIAQAATGPLWFQLYVYRNARPLAETLVRRAEAAGYRAIVVTVDAPRACRWDIPAELALPPLPLGNLPMDSTLESAALTWEDVDWLRSLTALPIVVKGILVGPDAALAVTHGAAGIVVSNHGGRTLDGVAASIDALPEVVAAANGRCEVYMDGGIRRGTDVLKALALGARAVLVGRPILWGLAARGDQGVQHVLELLRTELELAMALAGRPTLASIDGSLVAMG
jgi:isopentenyl diphosphate isomerase/L-lactate dehydrogenase-like FMN-dependent dehydrogenase